MTINPRKLTPGERPRRLLIIEPWWRQPNVHDWTGARARVRYTVLECMRGPTYVDGVYRPGEYLVAARTWTWRAALAAWEAAP